MSAKELRRQPEAGQPLVEISLWLIFFIMIIFIYGEDTFRSRQKLKDLKDKFIKEIDPGSNSLTILEGGNISLKEIRKSVGARSLLTKKCLIIIEDMFAAKNKTVFEEINNYLKKLKQEKDDNIIIFWESGIKTKKTKNKKIALGIDAPGKESPLPKNKQLLFDFLAKQPYTQEFKSLSNLETTAWIKKQFEKKGGTISNQAAQTLVSLAGNDLWQIDNEINKLISYKAGQEKKLIPADQSQEIKIISAEDVKKLVKGGIDENIFFLTDAISNKNKNLALKLLKDQYEAGLTDSHLISMITRQFRILLQIRQALDCRFTSQKMISSLKLHPYIIQKGINQVRNFSLESLKNILNNLIEIDYLAKTGQGEAKTLLNLFIQKI